MGNILETNMMEDVATQVQDEWEANPQTTNTIFSAPPATVGMTFNEAESEQRLKRIRKKVLGTKQLQIPLTTTDIATGDIPSTGIQL